MTFSSPVAETSSSTMRPLTRDSRSRYSSSSMFGQKLTSWMRVLVEPIRSIRPKRRSEEHTSELQSLMRHSYAVFCLNKKRTHNTTYINRLNNESHTMRKQNQQNTIP